MLILSNYVPLMRDSEFTSVSRTGEVKNAHHPITRETLGPCKEYTATTAATSIRIMCCTTQQKLHKLCSAQYNGESNVLNPLLNFSDLNHIAHQHV